MNHKGFLQAILAQPEDDALRLIYADYLEEHGQCDRAELIRVQIELARGVDDLQRRKELQIREDQLLTQHEWEWLGPLRKLVRKCEVRADARFQRGFVELMVLTAANFVKYSGLIFHSQPVRRVWLRNIGKFAQQLTQVSNLSRLFSLHLECCGDDFLAIEDFRDLLASPHLHELPELSLHLSLGGRETVEALVSSPLLPRLKDLTLTGYLGPDEVEILTASPSLQGLTALDLNNNAIGLRGVRALVSSPYLSGLTSLGLSFTWIGDAGARILSAAPLSAQLTELYLGESEITDEGAQAIIDSPYLGNLKHLGLWPNSDITKRSWERLEARFGWRALWGDLRLNV